MENDNPGYAVLIGNKGTDWYVYKTDAIYLADQILRVRKIEKPKKVNGILVTTYFEIRYTVSNDLQMKLLHYPKVKLIEMPAHRQSDNDSY